MALNVATEAALAGAYPAVHLGKREQKIVKILKTYIDEASGQALAEGDIWVGNGDDEATAVTMSGDATLSSAGALTIANSAITNAKVSASAAIAYSKLATLTSGNMLVGSAGNVATSVTMSGDATIVASGALTIANDAITTAKILNSNVTLAKLASGIAPSHVVKFAGKFTTAGGDANEQASVPGVVAGDIVIACLQDKGASPVTLLTSKPGTDVIDFIMSADPSTDHVISYQVLRAAA